MPGWSGAVGTNRYKTYGAVSTLSAGTILTGASLLHTKSPYIPICQSLEFNASGLIVGILPNVNPGGGGITEMFIDLAVGAAGSEVDIVRNMYYGIGQRSELGISYIFDMLQVPAGSRLSARYQTTITGSTSSLLAIPFVDDIADTLSLGRVTTYGVKLATTQGATIDPGGTANTFGGWTALVVSSDYPIKSVNFAFGIRNNPSFANANFLIDIGVGGAGSEQTIFTFPLNAMLTQDIFSPPVFGPIHLSIPRGSRVSARAQCTTNDATDRLFDMIMYCMD